MLEWELGYVVTGQYFSEQAFYTTKDGLALEAHVSERRANKYQEGCIEWQLLCNGRTVDTGHAETLREAKNVVESRLIDYLKATEEK